jgi:hypothetical protein
MIGMVVASVDLDSPVTQRSRVDSAAVLARLREWAVPDLTPSRRSKRIVDPPVAHYPASGVRHSIVLREGGNSWMGYAPTVAEACLIALTEFERSADPSYDPLVEGYCGCGRSHDQRAFEALPIITEGWEQATDVRYEQRRCVCGASLERELAVP